MHQKKDRWRTNKGNINATYETADAQSKKNCTRGTALGVRRNNTENEGEGMGGGQPGLFVRDLKLNSDVAANYKYRFGQQRGPLPHL